MDEPCLSCLFSGLDVQIATLELDRVRIEQIRMELVDSPRIAGVVWGRRSPQIKADT